jgi:hypothetical protein
MIRTATLDIPNIGRVRPDFEEMIIESAMDGIGTTVSKVLGHNSTIGQKLIEVAREEVAKTIRADLETPVCEWKDKRF